MSHDWTDPGVWSGGLSRAQGGHKSPPGKMIIHDRTQVVSHVVGSLLLGAFFVGVSSLSLKLDKDLREGE